MVILDRGETSNFTCGSNQLSRLSFCNLGKLGRVNNIYPLYEKINRDVKLSSCGCLVLLLNYAGLRLFISSDLYVACPLVCFMSWQHLRSYLDSYRLVTVHTHGEFIWLPHWETRLLAPIPNTPLSLIIRTLSQPVLALS